MQTDAEVSIFGHDWSSTWITAHAPSSPSSAVWGPTSLLLNSWLPWNHPMVHGFIIFIGLSSTILGRTFHETHPATIHDVPIPFHLRLLGALDFFFISHIYWEFHHPKLTFSHAFFRGVQTPPATRRSSSDSIEPSFDPGFYRWFPVTISTAPALQVIIVGATRTGAVSAFLRRHMNQTEAPTWNVLKGETSMLNEWWIFHPKTVSYMVYDGKYESINGYYMVNDG